MPCDLCGAPIVYGSGQPYKGEFYFCHDCDAQRRFIDLIEKTRIALYRESGSRRFDRDRAAA